MNNIFLNSQPKPLNVQIDPKLLIALKFEAIKSGKTLSVFITERLAQYHINMKNDILKKRLTRIEKKIDILNNIKLDLVNKINRHRSIFSDN